MIFRVASSVRHGERDDETFGKGACRVYLICAKEVRGDGGASYALLRFCLHRAGPDDGGHR